MLNATRRSSPARRLCVGRRQLLFASLVLLVGAQLFGLPIACSPSADGVMTLRVEALPESPAQTMGHWTYTLETAAAGRIEIAFVDVRRPDEGVGVTLDVEAGTPVDMDFFLPNVLEPWTERSRMAYDLRLSQGDRSARATELLPRDMLPEVLVSSAPGPISLNDSGPEGLTFALGSPIVLVSLIYPAEEPKEGDGYGLWQVGLAGEPGGPFDVPETLYHGTDQLVAEYPGAILQLRLRLTPAADE